MFSPSAGGWKYEIKVSVVPGSLSGSSEESFLFFLPVAAGIPLFVATSFSACIHTAFPSVGLHLFYSFSTSITLGCLPFGHRAHLNNLELSPHLRIISFILSAKTLFPIKVSSVPEI